MRISGELKRLLKRCAKHLNRPHIFVIVFHIYNLQIEYIIYDSFAIDNNYLHIPLHACIHRNYKVYIINFYTNKKVYKHDHN